MTKRLIKKLVHVGKYVAEVEVEMTYTDDDWSPYLSVDDAMKLDDVREALRHENFETAQKLSRYIRSPRSQFDAFSLLNTSEAKTSDVFYSPGYNSIHD